MQTCIHIHGIDFTESLRKQTVEKLGLALDRMENKVQRVDIDLVDINGPQLGGEDKVCRIVVQLDGDDSLVVEDVDSNVRMVIERATDRLGVIASQRLERRKSSPPTFLWQRLHRRFRAES